MSLFGKLDKFRFHLDAILERHRTEINFAHAFHPQNEIYGVSFTSFGNKS
jgi:hypothetical protein